MSNLDVDAKILATAQLPVSCKLKNQQTGLKIIKK